MTVLYGLTVGLMPRGGNGPKIASDLANAFISIGVPLVQCGTRSLWEYPSLSGPKPPLTGTPRIPRGMESLGQMIFCNVFWDGRTVQISIGDAAFRWDPGIFWDALRAAPHRFDIGSANVAVDVTTNSQI